VQVISVILTKPHEWMLSCPFTVKENFCTIPTSASVSCFSGQPGRPCGGRQGLCCAGRPGVMTWCMTHSVSFIGSAQKVCNLYPKKDKMKIKGKTSPNLPYTQICADTYRCTIFWTLQVLVITKYQKQTNHPLISNQLNTRWLYAVEYLAILRKNKAICMCLGSI
jgi:hypothetical protein